MPSSTKANNDYAQLCSRVDKFMREHLERGDYPPSTQATEMMYLAVARAFPEESDVLATLRDRMIAHGLLAEADNGEDLFTGIRLRAR